MGMRYGDRIEILNAHNEMREQIANGTVPGQPKSCDMKRMVSYL